MVDKTVYKYTDDSWIDGHDDCPCCSGLEFEEYNAVGWDQNGSATNMFDLYIQVICDYKEKEFEREKGYYEEVAWDLYEGFTLQELKALCERLGIVVEEVRFE